MKIKLHKTGISKKFVTDEILQDIAGHKNIYSKQKNGRNVNFTGNKLEKLLGVFLHGHEYLVKDYTGRQVMMVFPRKCLEIFLRSLFPICFLLITWVLQKIIKNKSGSETQAMDFKFTKQLSLSEIRRISCSWWDDGSFQGTINYTAVYA